MYIILRGSVDPGASVDLDNEPPQLLHCLHIQLHAFSFVGAFSRNIGHMHLKRSDSFMFYFLDS